MDHSACGTQGSWLQGRHGPHVNQPMEAMEATGNLWIQGGEHCHSMEGAGWGCDQPGVGACAPGLWPTRNGVGRAQLVSHGPHCASVEERGTADTAMSTPLCPLVQDMWDCVCEGKGEVAFHHMPIGPALALQAKGPPSHSPGVVVPLLGRGPLPGVVLALQMRHHLPMYGRLRHPLSHP